MLTQKEALGFKEGYITIFKGETYPHKDWFKENGCKYNKLWGWGLEGGKTLEELPAGIEAVKLEWDKVGSNEELKSDMEIRQYLDTIMYDPTDSEFQGEIKDRIEIQVEVIRTIELYGRYGASTMHIMKDSDGNEYVWTTASKYWEEGSVKRVKGTVKDHRIYRNSKQTVLTRCKEVAIP